MIEFKGTKGKWDVYTPDHMGCTNVKFGKDIWDGFVEIWHHQSSKEEAKSNAQLISKAPEMLEMLGKVLDHLTPEFPESSQELLLDEIKQIINEATTI